MTVSARLGARSLALFTLLLACRRRQPHPGETNPAPLPESQLEANLDATWETTLTAFRGRNGLLVHIRCTGNGTPHTVWGTDLYTDDSSVCTAGLHAGKLTAQGGGRFEIRIAPGQPAYLATARNGVTTQPYGSFAGSFTIVGGPDPRLTATPVTLGAGTRRDPPPPPPTTNTPTLTVEDGLTTVTPVPNVDPWTITASFLRGRNDGAFRLRCAPSTTSASVWGTDIYTDDSSICTAARHARAIGTTRDAWVTFYIRPGMPLYQGSIREGVTTQDYRNFPGSFSFNPVARALDDIPEGAQPITWSDDASTYRGQLSTTRRLYCPPNGTSHQVWGTDLYTDDSSVCTAAVHAGHITLARGGTFTLHPRPGAAVYQASTRHAVTTLAFEEYPGSFSLSR